jgi:polyferredoxin
MARWKAPFPILLADRFLPGAGWIEIVLLSLYAVFLTYKMSAQVNTERLRIRIWLAFSIVFFTQFILGITGVDPLLMTGRLHVPVPAVVLAGPIFRGSRFFMPILFLATIVLVGPAWCSHLCYIGAWDGLASRSSRRAGRLSALWTWVRAALLVATPLVAFFLRLAEVSGRTAGLVAIGFGILGAGIMAFLSPRKGVMVHCTSICPLGLVANLLGKISPFRLRISAACTDCGRCISACRYNALNPRQITRRRPGYTCTLCGDCLSACPDNALHYAFSGFSPRSARLIFLAVVISLHAVFLGVARI